MKTIAVDMDGVLADVYRQFLNLHFQDTGEKLSLESIRGLKEAEAFPLLKKHVNSPGFFESAPLIPGAQATLKKLIPHYKVFIVSAATEFPLSLHEKLRWLNNHFPFIQWQQMVFCGSKEIIRTDIMIDDHFKNLDTFSGKTYLFSQPHNEIASPGKHIRVNSWKEVEMQLLPDKF
ncbi:5' nucleotidase, NT5C type [Cyclobacterium jeungdonense]|uniref:5'(3')-deoxyribonucleotidase n=1 Tax=Cyclobacterium jeungdonense TaxID=708087 RepID=A0ABT8C1R2_9BACT|nr:5'(3')-deoxyribonucleotidase [Cyclobacterium jeungdonense]MDN3686420.1 5'(3')-deoxyribonucleotidase [Cyclobacterium jeungdonense]